MNNLTGPSGREYLVRPPMPEIADRYWMGTRAPDPQGVIAFAPSQAQLLDLLERAPASPVVNGIQTYHTYRICTPEDWAKEKAYYAALGVEPQQLRQDDDR